MSCLNYIVSREKYLILIVNIADYLIWVFVMVRCLL